MSTNNDSGCGFVTLVFSLIIAWALIFGVTYRGKHYGLGFSCDHGVTVQDGTQ